jgi:CRP-like cAMP-binding protein
MKSCGCGTPARERIAVSPEEAAGLCAGSSWGGGFSPEEWQAIAWRMHLERVPSGGTVFRQGDAEAYLAILARGAVEVVGEAALGQPRVLAILDAGAVFGELSLVDGEPRQATVRAVEDATLLVLPAEGFERLVREQTGLGVKLYAHVARLIAARLRQADGLLVEYLG